MVEQIIDNQALLQLFTKVSGKDGVKPKKDDDAALVIQIQTNAVTDLWLFTVRTRLFGSPSG